MTEENAELLLGSKANRGLLPAGSLPRLRRSRSSLPSIPYYDSQQSNTNLITDSDGYGDALTLQPVAEFEDGVDESEHVHNHPSPVKSHFACVTCVTLHMHK